MKSLDFCPFSLLGSLGKVQMESGPRIAFFRTAVPKYSGVVSTQRGHHSRKKTRGMPSFRQTKGLCGSIVTVYLKELMLTN